MAAQRAKRFKAGARRRARELALQTLFALEFHSGRPDFGAEALDKALEELRERASGSAEDESEGTEQVRGGPETQGFAELLVRGVVAHREAIDELLGQCSTNWKVPRMARVDRNILRMATFELRELSEIPPKVTLNEAIEIAKRYGSTDSGAFINGILDRIASLKVPSKEA